LVSILIDLSISVMLFNIIKLVQLSLILTLMYSIYNNIGRLVTKGYHGCKCCVPYIKARWSNHLRKLVYDCSKVFLPEDHPYRRVASAFNGKPKRTQRLEIMTLAYWIREYDIDKEKEMA
jgi:hypothetical protein